MISALVLAATVSVSDVPKPLPHGWVTDMANVISAASEAQINARLFDLRNATGHEVAVVTVTDVNAAAHLRDLRPRRHRAGERVVCALPVPQHLHALDAAEDALLVVVFFVQLVRWWPFARGWRRLELVIVDLSKRVARSGGPRIDGSGRA